MFMILTTSYYVVDNLRTKVSNVYLDISRNYTSNIAKLYIDEILSTVESKIIAASRDLGRREIDMSHAQEDVLRSVVSILDNSPELDAIIMTDKEGKFVRVPDNDNKDIFPDNSIKQRAWFIHEANSPFHIRFTEPHSDIFTGVATVTVSAPMLNQYGKFNGVLAFDINLLKINKNMEKMRPPIEGRIILLSSSGQHIADDMIDNNWEPDNIDSIYPLLKRHGGKYYDSGSNAWFFSYQFEGPRWTLIYTISNKHLQEQVWAETQGVVYGFVVLTIIVLSFGFYLKYHWGKKLFNIIGHIKTGTPEGHDNLENILSQEIHLSKNREKTLTSESQCDALTGALNRRAMESDLEKRIAEKKAFSFSLIDVDNFKNINDKYGHVAGDAVLKGIAAQCQDIVEIYGCHLYRYGGEEFAIIFDKMTIEQAVMVLKKCHTAVRDREWREADLTVTFSAGVSQFQNQEKHELIEQVDRLLYQAKQAGKDRTAFLS
ncbi:hypothetical protein C3432_25960 [Citrobacter amalonaticus]|uniref:diguanylate cyclase n=2 Tax=Citrobacter amalonaticus TaxID=35703 RepID=A0A2S4RR78_CITAM|nr:hypothetical protein C3432_25960 [Citrobacter amalonaticus]POT69943.1 hypothetical protein C3436_25755 [Citrobacter amalonaticus]POU61202.1 hypothetical protein C3430_24670 [Citrobacter amalonaticus]POV02556.1 hypothetical protein C3424_26000 [Citrobacter amalonaticus]